MRPPLQRHESASAANRKGRSWERGVKSETKASRGSDPARSCQLSPAAVWTAGRFATGPPTAGKSPAEFPTSERWRPSGGGCGKAGRIRTNPSPRGRRATVREPAPDKGFLYSDESVRIGPNGLGSPLGLLSRPRHGFESRWGHHSLTALV